VVRVLSRSGWSRVCCSAPDFLLCLCSSLHCRRIGYFALGQVAYIARACYMTETIRYLSVLLPERQRPCCRPSAGTLLLGQHCCWLPSEMLACSHRVWAPGGVGGERERRCTSRQQDAPARGRSSGGRTIVHPSSGRASSTQAYQAMLRDRSRRLAQWAILSRIMRLQEATTLQYLLLSPLLGVFTSRPGHGAITPHMSPRRRLGYAPVAR
jgi:hypothetical protein